MTHLVPLIETDLDKIEALAKRNAAETYRDAVPMHAGPEPAS